MTRDEHLIDQAGKIRDRLKLEALQSTSWLDEYKGNKTDFTFDLVALYQKISRAPRFQPSLAKGAQCPWCWIMDGVQQSLASITDADKEDPDGDAYECSVCRFRTAYAQ